MTTTLRKLSQALAAAALVLFAAPTVGAHTVPDYVAVPAGSEATLTLRPTHGCGASPTIEVAVRAPVEGASAGSVSGWVVAAEPDGSGNTILTWSGGVLAADRAGAFPITFTVPDTVGALLLFPAVQTCQNGEELAWISGDPESEYPAPRILILAPGSSPAPTIDQVPLDAPGRDLLVEVIDVDNPDGTTTTTSTSTTTPETTTTAPVTTTTVLSATTTSTPPGEALGSGEGPGSGALIAIAAGAILAVGLGVAVLRRRSAG